MLGLTQQNLEEFEARFWRVSDPSHPDYGQWLTVEEIAEMIAPKPVTISRATAYVFFGGFVGCCVGVTVGMWSRCAGWGWLLIRVTLFYFLRSPVTSGLRFFNFYDRP